MPDDQTKSTEEKINTLFEPGMTVCFIFYGREIIGKIKEMSTCLPDFPDFKPKTTLFVETEEGFCRILSSQVQKIVEKA